MKRKRPRCRVYAVELGPREVYVGATRLSVRERFRQHKAGGKTSSGVVRRRGKRLRPDLSAGYSSEKKLAASLRSRGFKVRGGTRKLSEGLRRKKPCGCKKCRHARGLR